MATKPAPSPQMAAGGKPKPLTQRGVTAFTAGPQPKINFGPTKLSALPDEPMSTGMKLGIAAVVAAGGYFLWSRRRS